MKIESEIITEQYQQIEETVVFRVVCLMWIYVAIGLQAANIEGMRLSRWIATDLLYENLKSLQVRISDVCLYDACK